MGVVSIHRWQTEVPWKEVKENTQAGWFREKHATTVTTAVGGMVDRTRADYVKTRSSICSHGRINDISTAALPSQQAARRPGSSPAAQPLRICRRLVRQLPHAAPHSSCLSPAPEAALQAAAVAQRGRQRLHTGRCGAGAACSCPVRHSRGWHSCRCRWGRQLPPARHAPARQCSRGPRGPLAGGCPGRQRRGVHPRQRHLAVVPAVVVQLAQGQHLDSGTDYGMGLKTV